MTPHPFRTGATVYGTGGQKVGTIRASTAPGRYLVVRTRWPFPVDLHIPLYAVRGTDVDGAVHLDLRPDNPQANPAGHAQGPSASPGCTLS
jgi:hypothetical protein